MNKILESTLMKKIQEGIKVIEKIWKIKRSKIEKINKNKAIRKIQRFKIEKRLSKNNLKKV